MRRDISAVIIGKDIDALQAALYLAQVGIKVKFITDVPAFAFTESGGRDERVFWSVVLEAIKHPSIEFFYNAESVNVAGKKSGFIITVTQKQTYVNNELCTGCKKCEDNCSTLLSRVGDLKTINEHAVHKPYPGYKSVPSAVVISKNEISPCRASCPLGINVQGFISLLANNKVNEAYDLINSAAPLGGVLGRLCKHPCEDVCCRGKLDSPVSIRALHRFAYDNVSSLSAKKLDFPAAATRGKVAVVGSGPAGLMAAWELKRRGYEPTIFESHGTYGGMLATGIPRFRLSREIREREINKIIDMGIRIRTGITVGRDIDFAYLRERGYKACFLAIGASKNSKLNVPGEELEGVIDCMSFLITLNQMGDTFVGSNIVVIGDGNTAVDSARVAIRKNMGNVKIISWTVPNELTASEDEIQEAFQEGVSIEYSAYPVEILGDGTRVLGVRCQRTRLTDYIMRNGQHRPEPVPGTDFVIDADHVIVAIGQAADASQLNLDGLDIDRSSGTIRVNPATLETNMRGFFAGGDCMRGPNNVVEAMADGLKAAESIDRYMSDSDMYAGRGNKPVKVAEVDLATIVASNLKRADMPYLDLESRKNDYEETTLGFPPETAMEEAKRCINCAFCSECMECVKVCGANAVAHNNGAQARLMSSDIVLRFSASVPYSVQDTLDSFDNSKGIYDLQTGTNATSLDMADMVRTLLDLNLALIGETGEGHNCTTLGPSTIINGGTLNGRVGIFLCRCNGNNDEKIDFNLLTSMYRSRPYVDFILEIDQMCTENGAKQVSRSIRDEHISHAAIAACRCCNNDQTCYSCNDRRILCRKHMNNSLEGQDDLSIAYVNIRELCAWVHNYNRHEATDKATRMIESAIARAEEPGSIQTAKYPIKPSVVFIGDSPAWDTSARVLTMLGYSVFCVYSVADAASLQTSTVAGGAGSGLPVYKRFSDSLEFSGHPGSYQVKLQSAAAVEIIEAGAVVLSAGLKLNAINKISGTYLGNLFRRMKSRLDKEETNEQPSQDGKYLRALAAAGIFIVDDLTETGSDERGQLGFRLAARIVNYLCSKWIASTQASSHVDQTLCRGCGECASQCPLIELQEDGQGHLLASFYQCFCTGCGLCSSVCPTGAIRSGELPVNAVSSIIELCVGPAPFSMRR